MGKIYSNMENFHNLSEEEKKKFRPIYFGSAEVVETEVITSEQGDTGKKKPGVKKNSS